MTKQSTSSDNVVIAALQPPKSTTCHKLPLLLLLPLISSSIPPGTRGFSPTSLARNTRNMGSHRLRTAFLFHATHNDNDGNDEYQDDDDDDYKHEDNDDERDDEEGIDANIPDFETKRMEIVRILQKTYYRSMEDETVDERNVDEFLDSDETATLSSSSSLSSSIQPQRRSKRPQLDKSTGKISNLPLWRVGWVETPGRRNCLNVHEGKYTHMFETIFATQSTVPSEPASGSSPSASPSASASSWASFQSDEIDDDNNWMDLPSMYFGHLHLPGGTSSALSGREKFRLKTWKEELADESRFYDVDDDDDETPADRKNALAAADSGKLQSIAPDRSAVVGCLMHILDHRRMDDGRLVVLVQAVERFVVEEVLETKPYCVADVQILPDQEDLAGWNADGTVTSAVAAATTAGKADDENDDDAARKGDLGEEMNESECKHIRGEAVTASFYYHDYEFDDVKLPIAKTTTLKCNEDDDDENFVSKDEVPWLGISKLLPFAHYSSDDKSLDAANEKLTHALNPDKRKTISVATTTKNELPLERQLWNGGILWNPPPVSKVVIRRIEDTTDCDTLETLLWLALDDFCRATKFVLPEEVRCLVPPEMDYLDIHPASLSSSSSSMSSSSSQCSLSPLYPKIRRQRRLSYLAPALIENLEVGKGMRQIWLNTPSTKARLLGVLERFDYLNNQLMGQFE
mmetsp:Transcript_21486/g.44698  ORF Transcript_21486/g.44698 Transcript_21486/m.44698 type:complete len:689 (-) Transcript_21486:8-2074(-)